MSDHRQHGGYRDYSVGGRGRRGGGPRNDRGGQGFAKRKREDEEPVDPMKLLLATLIRLGDRIPGQPAPNIEDDVEVLAKNIARKLYNNSDVLCQYLIDCAVELGTKVPVYATLIGLINAEDSAFVGRLVQQAAGDFGESLARGDRHRARLLLRFFAALSVSNVIHASSVLAALEGVVQAAIGIASEGADFVCQGGTPDEGRWWQPYADQVVYSALVALPWGGAELADSAPADMARLLDAAARYMGLRPRAHQPALRAFWEPRSEDDAAARSDSGGASFLGEVWEAVQEWVDVGTWVVEGVPKMGFAFEATLAAGQPHDLPALAVPPSPPNCPPPASPAEAAAAVAAAFPPRGTIRLLAPEHTRGERLAIERLVAEEYILDVIHYWDGDRVECAVKLAQALPLPYKYESLLAELLFSQLLAVPSPPFKPLSYSTIMVDLCKLMPTFPRSMSACVRECFARMAVMDPELRVRLAEWLAYHLSNFEFVWPWDKWKHVLDAPSHDAQRHFVVAVLLRLIRLSYWERVQSAIPEHFTALLPPKPDILPLPSSEAVGENGNANGVDDAEGKRAAELLQMVRRKVVAEGVLNWVAEQRLEEELGGPVGVLRCVFRGLLVAGAKSFTHMITALERYMDVLQHLLQQTGAEGEEALVECAAAVWGASPLRASMAIDRIMALRLVTGATILRWAFASPGVLSLDQELASGLAWEAVHIAVSKTLARTQDAREDMAGIQKAIADASAALEAATQQLDQLTSDAAGDMAANGVSAAGIEEARQAEMHALEALRALDAPLADKEQYMHEAATQQEELLLLVFQSFKEVLASSSPLESEDDTQAARQAWFAFTLAQLRAFCRRYYLQVSALAERVETELFAEDQVDAAVRAVVVETLHF